MTIRGVHTGSASRSKGKSKADYFTRVYAVQNRDISEEQRQSTYRALITQGHSVLEKDTRIRNVKALAWCYEAIYQFDEAVEQLNKISNRDESVLLTIARCYEKKGDSQLQRHQHVLANQAFEQARNAVVKIPRFDKNVLAVERLAHLYDKVGDLENALLCHIKWFALTQSAGAPRYEICKAIARFNLDLGNYQEAYKAIFTIPDKKLDEAGSRLRHDIPLTILHQAWKYFDAGDYHSALNIIDNHFRFHVAPLDLKDECIMLRTRCFREMGDAENEVVALLDYRDENRDPRFWLDLAIAHGKSGDLGQERLILTQLQRGELSTAALEDEVYKNVLIRLAINCNKSREYENAKIILQSIRGWETDPDVLFCMGVQEAGKGFYLEAIHYFEAMKRYSKDGAWIVRANIRLAEARVHLWQFQEAEKILKEIPFKERVKNEYVANAFGHLYFKLTWFEKAIEYFTLSLDIKWNIFALKGLAQCYQRMGMIEKAGVLLIEHAYNGHELIRSEPLRVLARIYNDIGLHGKAIELLTKIPQFEKCKYALLGVAYAYEMLNDVENASHYLSLGRENFSFSSDVALSTVIFQMKQGDLIESVLATFAEILTRFPDDSSIWVYYCQYLVEQQLPDAYSILETALERFSHVPALYQVKAKFYRDHGNLQKALDVLITSSEQFPYHVPTQLDLVRQYLLMERFDLAKAHREKCAVVGQNRLLFSSLDKLIEKAEAIQVAGHEGLGITFSEEKVEIKPPAVLLECMNELRNVGLQSCFLVGGAVTKLLAGRNDLVDCTDLDFMTNDPNAYEKLSQIGFSTCPHIPQLFKRFSYPAIDVMHVPKVSTEQGWELHSNALSRDFTISALYFGRPSEGSPNGTLYDPTDKGIADLRAMRLRMIGHASNRLKEDPTRLLRAVKYIQEGFKPTNDLHFALSDWKLTSILDDRTIGRIHALVQKHLNILNDEQKAEYYAILVRYHLVEKLFGMTEADFQSLFNLNIKPQFNQPSLEHLTNALQHLSLDLSDTSMGLASTSDSVLEATPTPGFLPSYSSDNTHQIGSSIRSAYTQMHPNVVATELELAMGNIEQALQSQTIHKEKQSSVQRRLTSVLNQATYTKAFYQYILPRNWGAGSEGIYLQNLTVEKLKQAIDNIVSPKVNVKRAGKHRRSRK